MITNAREYEVTKNEAHKFEHTLSLMAPIPGQDPRIHQARKEAMESQLAELRANLEMWEHIQRSAYALGIHPDLDAQKCGACQGEGSLGFDANPEVTMPCEMCSGTGKYAHTPA